MQNLKKHQENKQPTLNCYFCGKPLAGKRGIDFHFIRSGSAKRFYCLECIKEHRDDALHENDNRFDKYKVESEETNI